MSIDIHSDKRIRELYAELSNERSHQIEQLVYSDMAPRLLAERDGERAVAVSKHLVSLDEQSALAHFELAKALMMQGQWREGGRELEVATELDSLALAGRKWSGNNLYYVAYAFLNLGSYKEAAEAFRGAQNLIDTWGDPLILKRFHWHQGIALHYEGQYLEAAEAYRRAMVAPGPGDSCPEDEMDEDEVETAQDLNDEIEPYMDFTQRGQSLDTLTVDLEPAFA